MTVVREGKRFRLAVVATHPIQYQAPLWRQLARGRDIEVHVFYASSHLLDRAFDPGFCRSFSWDIPLTGGYDHEFLASRRFPVFNGPVADRWPVGLSGKLAARRYDAVLVHGYATGAAWAGMTAAWRRGLPVLMRGETHRRCLQSTRGRILKRLVLPTILARVSGIMAIGSWNRDYWLHYGVPEARVLTSLYSVDNDFFKRASDLAADEAASLRRKWQAREDDTVFLFCARLADVKAPEILIEAFARLNSPKARLVFVGSGPLAAKLAALQSELGLMNVYWEGFVNQSALPARYRAADVLVLPSRHEPWGLVVNEAMACGTPCIVSDVVGAAPDLIAPGPAGRVFRSGDAQALAEALGVALSRETREAWRAGIPGTLEKASFAHNERTFVELLERVTGRAAARSSPADMRAEDAGSISAR